MSNLKSSFDIALACDTHVVLVDRDEGASVTNDADAVVERLQNTLPGGIGRRKVFYRDTMGRFDELAVASDGHFAGFRPCSEGQQESLSRQVLISS